MEKYRVECGSVYEYDSKENRYLFCGKLNGRTLPEFIDDKNMAEDMEMNDDRG